MGNDHFIGLNEAAAHRKVLNARESFFSVIEFFKLSIEQVNISFLTFLTTSLKENAFFQSLCPDQHVLQINKALRFHCAKVWLSHNHLVLTHNKFLLPYHCKLCRAIDHGTKHDRLNNNIRMPHNWYVMWPNQIDCLWASHMWRCQADSDQNITSLRYTSTKERSIEAFSTDNLCVEYWSTAIQIEITDWEFLTALR